MILCALSLFVWLGIFFHPARPWDFRPVAEDEDPSPAPPVWPSVCVLVPARNEGGSLPHTLPALLQQDYPGEFAVIVIDDRSQDRTAEIARRVAEEAGAAARLTVVSGKDLPDGWVGKVWALEQGAYHCGLPVGHESPSHSFEPRTPRPPQYVLLTDADIRHAPESLRCLVAQSERQCLALNSRMARLRCVSGPERLLIPPFVFFFNLLYPMRQVNDPRSAVAAAAGGCVLVASSALERIGGFACIKNEIIDDVNLARHIKRLNQPIYLALSRNMVESLRAYESFSAIWAMVRRTAFTELRYSWLRLMGTLVGLAVVFLLPPLSTMGGAALICANLVGWGEGSFLWTSLLGVIGFWAWALMSVVYRPAVRFFGLSYAWAWTLPLAGVLYQAMTLDSALRYAAGVRTSWRDR